MSENKKEDPAVTVVVCFFVIWLIIVIGKIVAGIHNGDFPLEPEPVEFKSVYEQIQSEREIQ